MSEKPKPLTPEQKEFVLGLPDAVADAMAAFRDQTYEDWKKFVASRAQLQEDDDGEGEGR